MRGYPDGMNRFTLLAAVSTAALMLALPAAAAGPSGWRAGSGGIPSPSYNLLRAVSSSVALAGDSADGRLVRTVDGGRSWTATTPPSEVGLVDVASQYGSTIYVVDADRHVFRSRNAGAGWTQLDVRAVVAPRAVATLPGGRVLLVGARSLALSSDGGDSFQSVTPALARGDYFTGVDHARSGLVVWGAHSLLASTDGARTWRHMRLPHLSRGDGLLAVDFVARRVGFVLTQFRHFYRTTNAGHHWGEMLGTAGAGADLAFSDRRHGWLAAPGFANRFDGYALRTSDGGVTWRPEAVAPGFLSHVAAAGATAYAIANQGMSLYATQGGESGTKITIGFRPVPRSTRRGGRVRIRGRVNPGLRGVGVAVSMRAGGRWIVRWVHTRARGVFVARFTVPKTAAFVAQVPAVAGHGSAATRPVAVRVVR